MNKILKTYLPALSIAFTFIVLYATISNLVTGYFKDGFCFFILQVFIYLIVSIVVDLLLSFIDFRKYIYHFIVEMIMLYSITITMAFIGKWFVFNAIDIIWYSCIYILVMLAIHFYFYYISKKQASEINSLLELRDKRKQQWEI